MVGRVEVVVVGRVEVVVVGRVVVVVVATVVVVVAAVVVVVAAVVVVVTAVVVVGRVVVVVLVARVVVVVVVDPRSPPTTSTRVNPGGVHDPLAAWPYAANSYTPGSWGVHSKRRSARPPHTFEGSTVATVTPFTSSLPPTIPDKSAA